MIGSYFSWQLGALRVLLAWETVAELPACPDLQVDRKFPVLLLAAPRTFERPSGCSGGCPSGCSAGSGCSPLLETVSAAGA